MSSSELFEQENNQLQKETITEIEYNPPYFPKEIIWEIINFKNWSGEIQAYNIPCCTPKSIEEVITVVNWAWKENYKLRPIGQSHNWSPLILESGQSFTNRIMLMDLSPHFSQVSIEHRSQFSIVTAQTGILMEKLMTQMEEQGLGFTATPAPGDLTLGAVLAIGGHGTAINALDETLLPGHTFGSLSNTILSLSAIVWDEENQQYAIKQFERSDPNCAPLLTHIGSALILEVQLQAGKNQRLRCQSFTDIPAAELFASSENAKGNRTFSQFLDQSGRAEIILFPFTYNPWLKVWSVAPTQPPSSIEVNAPYNYPFSDNIPLIISDLVKEALSINPSVTPFIGEMQYLLTNIALQGREKDIWGWSKNLLLYVKPTTLRVTANGYAVLTRRADIQRVLSVFYSQWKNLIEEFEIEGKYPINGPLEVRVTGLDKPAEVMHEKAVAPGLSAIRPRLDHPEWDVAVWLDILTFPNTPYSIEFLRKFEQWLFQEFNGTYASARVEWSKGWAYGKTTAWEDTDVLTKKIPASFTDSLSADNNWALTISALQKYDPHHVFRSPLLNKLLSD
ncbi:cholesterol oxidase substrate-binding domain-containing protein [Xenorhabdus anantnagensis]|uniref:Cholesterol oxidase substrate-binding domain-containing protein n=1 Tax=Xenorhabdus anantnagensis TaxID=3025875 RepID=A0ABT5LPG5_9GAMM|nr:cholesterol oxidase substrate-binding domain-containing protein [Xenorhabdus anantnagensis]MDC9595641.1 cholesterol oxidase substrate-binding domain-containing protein [Xenorhabdus anantnagensis]